MEMNKVVEHDAMRVSQSAVKLEHDVAVEAKKAADAKAELAARMAEWAATSALLDSATKSAQAQAESERKSRLAAESQLDRMEKEIASSPSAPRLRRSTRRRK